MLGHSCAALELSIEWWRRLGRAARSPRRSRRYDVLGSPAASTKSSKTLNTLFLSQAIPRKFPVCRACVCLRDGFGMHPDGALCSYLVSCLVFQRTRRQMSPCAGWSHACCILRMLCAIWLVYAHFHGADTLLWLQKAN